MPLASGLPASTPTLQNSMCQGVTLINATDFLFLMSARNHYDVMNIRDSASIRNTRRLIRGYTRRRICRCRTVCRHYLVPFSAARNRGRVDVSYKTAYSRRASCICPGWPGGGCAPCHEIRQ